jgi:hypothetical protein
VDDAQALDNTLSRIRHRYALHFHLPEGVQPGQERNIEVELSAAALRRYPGAEVRYRRVYFTPSNSTAGNETVVVTQTAQTVEEPAPPAKPRRGWRRVDEPASEPETADEDQKPAEPQRGWRRIKPGEEP